MQLYSIQLLEFSHPESKFFETYLDQLGASAYRYWTENYGDLTQLNWKRERERENAFQSGLLVFIIYKNLDVSAKILSHALSRRATLGVTEGTSQEKRGKFLLR